jgi:hypothetical protein
MLQIIQKQIEINGISYAVDIIREFQLFISQNIKRKFSEREEGIKREGQKYFLYS